MANLLDAAMARHGGKSWPLRASDSPTSGPKDEKTIGDPISLPTFVAGACRSLTTVRDVTIIFDVQMSVPGFAPLHQVADILRRNDAKS